MDKALKQQSITVNVNPLQTAVLMDAYMKALPDIRTAFATYMPSGMKMDFDALEATIAEIYVRCYADIPLVHDAMRIYETTGNIPDIEEVIVSRADNDVPIPGPDSTRPITIEVAPFHAMMVIFIIRGYANQFFPMIHKHFDKLMHLNFEAMQDSVDEIYEKCIALTDIRSKTAPIMAVYEMTGTLPNLDEVLRKDAKAN